MSNMLPVAPKTAAANHCLVSTADAYGLLQRYAIA